MIKTNLRKQNKLTSLKVILSLTIGVSFTSLISAQQKNVDGEIYYKSFQHILLINEDLDKISFKVHDSLLVVNPYILDSSRLSSVLINAKAIKQVDQNVLWHELLKGLETNNRPGKFPSRRTQRRIHLFNNGAITKCEYALSYSRIVRSKNKCWSAMLVRKESDCLADILELCVLRKREKEWEIAAIVPLI